jgi:hypothetical protein
MRPCTAWWALSPPTNFSSQAPLWRQGQRIEPQDRRLVHYGSAGALPKCYARNPHQGEYNDIFRYTIEEPRSVAGNLFVAQSSRRISRT